MSEMPEFLKTISPFELAKLTQQAKAADDKVFLSQINAEWKRRHVEILETEAQKQCPECRGRGLLAGGLICKACNGRITQRSIFDI